MAPPQWRRHADDDIWHSWPGCSRWPTGNFYLTATRPVTGTFCEECLSSQQETVVR